eukprot:GHVU01140940.1.p1 GENE.GHVU01140940.1~~GHVU01140940.1.p1  ORF type:complete len:154 (+),score=7.11 GHVU01140940.1:147-608(+)
MCPSYFRFNLLLALTNSQGPANRSAAPGGEVEGQRKNTHPGDDIPFHFIFPLVPLRRKVNSRLLHQCWTLPIMSTQQSSTTVLCEDIPQKTKKPRLGPHHLHLRHQTPAKHGSATAPAHQHRCHTASTVAIHYSCWQVWLWDTPTNAIWLFRP